MTNIELKSTEEYTHDQLRRVMHNMTVILDICEPLLENKTMELVYTCANDSLVRLEGVTHYEDKENH